MSTLDSLDLKIESQDVTCCNRQILHAPHERLEVPFQLTLWVSGNDRIQPGCNTKHWTYWWDICIFAHITCYTLLHTYMFVAYWIKLSLPKKKIYLSTCSNHSKLSIWNCLWKKRKRVPGICWIFMFLTFNLWSLFPSFLDPSIAMFRSLSPGTSRSSMSSRRRVWETQIKASEIRWKVQCLRMCIHWMQGNTWKSHITHGRFI